ncbi:MAG: sugar phosphate nucleotidyltransferase [Candidatus Kapabacteria bacterium]|jgi:glucose-1-phosphate thymidylyltransferase|nr:sugar phosphate nucleotidyltransferase [Candidatus Kapabacteria bacterium]
MHAIIPVAGIGTRLRPFTHTLPKVLVNVAGKPILGHILDALETQGVTTATIVTGYKGDLVEDYVRSASSINATFVEQTEMLGLGHAIWTARASLATEPVLIILGDTVFDVDLSVLNTAAFSSLGVKSVDDPRRFGVVIQNGAFVSRLVEKPETPVSTLAIVGLYYIKQPWLLAECLGELIDGNVRTKGEFQLTDALQMMVDKGEKFTTFPVDGWHDCGKPETLLATNRFLLNQRQAPVAPKGCVIIPPAHVDPTAVIEHSVIGPYASISKGAVVRNSIIRDSIICDAATVTDMTLEGSIIGENAEVSGKFASINLGDASVVRLFQ